MEIRVYYEDTDMSGHVYHANYLKYFDRGREEALGVDTLAQYAADGIHFVVRQLSVRYRRPAKLGDILTVRTDFPERRGPRVPVTQSIWRGAELITEAEIELVTVNAVGKPLRINMIPKSPS